MKPTITVFFPCYNDAGTIGVRVMRAIQTLREVSDDYEVLVINDGSADDSRAILEERARLYPREFCFENRTQPSGYGGVLRAGFAKATKDWIFYTDGDAQYDARELKLLTDQISDNVDFINGWKIKRRDPLIRIWIGMAYQYFVKAVFGLKIRDVDCDFRLMRREIFDVIELDSSTGTITLELVKKAQDAGFRFIEVPVRHYYRQYGESQFFNFPRVARTLLALIGWWWRLVVKQEAVKAYRPKRDAQIAARKNRQ
jgi:glycosyltransferase involved in cell wall biosynthesis